MPGVSKCSCLARRSYHETSSEFSRSIIQRGAVLSQLDQVDTHLQGYRQSRVAILRIGHEDCLWEMWLAMPLRSESPQ